MKVLGPSYHNTKEKIVKMFNAAKIDSSYYDLTGDQHAVLWFPVMKAKVYNGWNNIGFDNNETILEYNSNEVKEQEHMKYFVHDTDFDQIRFTFSKLNGDYHFLGIYQLDREGSLRKGQCIWRRMCQYYVLLPALGAVGKKKKTSPSSTSGSKAKKTSDKPTAKADGNDIPVTEENG